MSKLSTKSLERAARDEKRFSVVIKIPMLISSTSYEKPTVVSKDEVSWSMTVWHTKSISDSIGGRENMKMTGP